jgi:hypothetical protein
VKVYFDWEHAIFGSPVFGANLPNGHTAFQSSNDLFWARLQFYY